MSVVDIAAQLGHNPTVCLDTYAHVMAEQRGAKPVNAAEQLADARRDAGSPAAHVPGEQLSFMDLDG